MYLTKSAAGSGSIWANNGNQLAAKFSFKEFMQLPQDKISAYVEGFSTANPAGKTLLPPIEYDQEVWAAGVTYYRSRDAREAETEVKDIYSKVYLADRPELFFKSIGWLSSGPILTTLKSY